MKSSNERNEIPITTYRDPKEWGRMLALDFIGPLTPAKRQNQHIFVAIDVYSKKVFVKAFRTATVEGIKPFLEQNIFWEFQTPEVMLSDNGSQFISKRFAELCEKYKIKHWRTPARFPRANYVEASNKQIKNILRCLLNDKAGNLQADWDLYLPHALKTLNTTPHTSTGYSPHYTIHGKEKTETGDEFHRLLDINKEANIDEARLNWIHDDVATNLEKSHDKSAKQFNLRTRNRVFKSGAQVYVRTHLQSNAGQRFTNKLAPIRKAVTVLEPCNEHENTYVLQNTDGTTFTAHASQIYNV